MTSLSLHFSRQQYGVDGLLMTALAYLVNSMLSLNPKLVLKGLQSLVTCFHNLLSGTTPAFGVPM